MKGLRVAQAADLLISFEKVFVLQRLGNEIVAAGATAERERSQRRAARKQLAALPLEMKNNNNNRRVKKGKISERGLRAPGRVGSPRPAPSPGPRHLIPLLAAGPPRKAPGGGERIRAAGGSPRRRGGEPLSAFPFGITMPLPTRPPGPPSSPARRGRGRRKGKGRRSGESGREGGKLPCEVCPVPVLTVRGAGQSRACWPRCCMERSGRRRGCEGRSSAASQCRLSSVNEPPLSEGLPAAHTHTHAHTRAHTHTHTRTPSRAQHCIH